MAWWTSVKDGWNNGLAWAQKNLVVSLIIAAVFLMVVIWIVRLVP